MMNSLLNSLSAEKLGLKEVLGNNKIEIEFSVTMLFRIKKGGAFTLLQ